MTAAIILGFFWSYSFATRIGLFAVVPFWLKIVLITTLTANFSLLAYYLLENFFLRIIDKRNRIGILVASLMICGLIFFLAPYQRVPFRTTHLLEIRPIESETIIRAIYSPDDNLISRDAFVLGDGVVPFSAEGFRIPHGSSIVYQRAHTGKLTVFMQVDSGSAQFTWDGTTHRIDADEVPETGRSRMNGWRVSQDSDTGDIIVRLPGNTWGNPDLLWAFLGGLMPVSDFVALSSVLVCLFLIGVSRSQEGYLGWIKSDLSKTWIDALVSLSLLMVLFNAGFPEFMPFWFLLLFMPVVFYLFYQQAQFLRKRGLVDCVYLSRIEQAVNATKSLIISLNQNRWVFWVLIILVGILGSLTQLSLTTPGMNISGDSVHYMEGARNLAMGRGYVQNIAVGDPVHITGFDPGYSLSLVPGVLLGLDAQTAARLLNLFLFFMTVLLVGWIIFKTTGKVLPAVIANLFLVMSPIIFSIFSSVMSEPLFIVLLLGTFLAWFYQIEDSALWKVILAGMMATLMIITRFAGIVFLPVLAVTILFFKQAPVLRRIRDTFIFGAIALVGPAIFYIRNRLVKDTIINGQGRVLVPFSQEDWEVIGSEISSWFKWQAYFNYDHQRFNAVFISLGLILILVVGWFLFRKRLGVKRLEDPIIITLFLSGSVYFASIIINSMISSPKPTPSGLIRYLIPVLIILFILLGKVLSVYWQIDYLFPKLAIFFIVLVGLQLYQADYERILREQPLAYRHYTDRKNECGDAVNAIVDSMPGVAFYANTCEYYYFLTNQQCHRLSFDVNAYAPGGDIYQAVKEGAVIAIADGFGSNPPGIGILLNQMDNFTYTCYLHFYRGYE